MISNAVILKRQRLIFFLVPKAANSAVKSAILDALGLGDAWTPDNVPHHHPALGPITNMAAAGAGSEFFKIGLVRNPFDRLVSCWAQKICTERIHTQGFDQIGFRANMPFTDFVEVVARDPLANVHFMPQVKFVPAAVDYLARCETLAEDWARIRQLIGDRFPQPLGPLPKINTSRRGPYRRYFDERSRTLAETIYAQDLERFGYAWN